MDIIMRGRSLLISIVGSILVSTAGGVKLSVIYLTFYLLPAQMRGFEIIEKVYYWAELSSLFGPCVDSVAQPVSAWTAALENKLTDSLAAWLSVPASIKFTMDQIKMHFPPVSVWALTCLNCSSKLQFCCVPKSEGLLLWLLGVGCKTINNFRFKFMFWHIRGHFSPSWCPVHSGKIGRHMQHL